MNWPNRLSLLRIVCVPILVILLSLSSSWSVWAAAAVFALAAATDFLDGHLARKNNWITQKKRLAFRRKRIWLPQLNIFSPKRRRTQSRRFHPVQERRQTSWARI